MVSQVVKIDVGNLRDHALSLANNAFDHLGDNVLNILRNVLARFLTQ